VLHSNVWPRSERSVRWTLIVVAEPEKRSKLAVRLRSDSLRNSGDFLEIITVELD